MRTPVLGTQLFDRVRWPGSEPVPVEPGPTRAVLARTFTYLYGAGGLLALATLLLPHGEGRSVPGVALPAIGALLCAAVTTFAYDRIPIWVFRWLPVLGTLLATVVVHSGDPGSMIPYSAFYFWVVLSAFYLFDARWAWMNVAFVGLALALALLDEPRVEDRALGWVMMMGGLSVGGGMTGLLRSRLERLVGESQAALRRALESEQALAEAQRIARVGSWEVDLRTRRFEGSPQLFRMLGLHVGRFTTLDEVLEGLGGAESERLRAGFRAAVERSMPADVIHAVSLPGGQRRIMQTRGQVIREGTEPARLVGTTQDVTERRLQEERLQRILRRLRATIDIGLALGRERHPAGLLRLISERAQTLLEAQAVFIELAGEDGAQRVAVAGELPHEHERDRARTLRVPLVYHDVEHGVLVAVARSDRAGFSDDEDEMLRAFAASAAAAVAGMKTVQEDALRRSIEASERERQRFAHELHDQTLQSLGVLRMGLESALGEGTEALRPATERALGVIAEEVENLRRIIADLRPALLDDMGLSPALSALTERMRAEYGFDVRCGIRLRDGRARLTPEIERTIYRVVQEALTNVGKHADARHADVTVREDEQAIRVVVRDDGRGIPEGTKEGFGLAGMRERLLLLGGTLAVGSGGGTTVEAVLPLSGTGTGT